MTMRDIDPHMLRTQARRQAILDYVRAHPQCAITDVRAAMPQFSETEIDGDMRRMVRWGELESLPRRHGFRPGFIAIARTTRTAQEIYDSRRRDCAEDSAKRAESRPKNRPGYYRHEPGSLGYTSSGGQGALRASVSIQCGGSGIE